MDAILTILPLLIAGIIIFNFIAIFMRRTEKVERFYHTFHNTSPSCLPIGHRQFGNPYDLDPQE